MINLSPSGDLVEAAANLFAALRALDAAGAAAHRGDADPGAGPGRGHQRPAAPRCETRMSQKAKPTILSPDLVARFADIVGREHALTDPDQQLPYLREMRDMYEGRSSLVLRPASTEQVSKILALAHEHGIAVVPQAGNTGLVGGQTAMHGEIVLSVARLKRVRGGRCAGLQHDGGGGPDAGRGAGRRRRRSTACFRSACRRRAAAASAATSAPTPAASAVLAYGNARQLVLGLEVVLADGRVWNGLNALKKDNTGYDLKDLFIGSEGTLGVITAAVLKLFPKPAEKATAFVGLSDLESALPLFSLAQETAGTSLTAFEVMARIVRGVRAPGMRRARAIRWRGSTPGTC